MTAEKWWAIIKKNIDTFDTRHPKDGIDSFLNIDRFDTCVNLRSLTILGGLVVGYVGSSFFQIVSYQYSIWRQLQALAPVI